MSSVPDAELAQESVARVTGRGQPPGRARRAQPQGGAAALPGRAPLDPELADRITTFLDRRRRDVTSLLEALDAGDFQAIRRLARRIKDVGEGYGWFDHAHHPELVEGLDALTDMACALEQAAKGMLAEEIHLCIHDLVTYLARLRVRDT